MPSDSVSPAVSPDGVCPAAPRGPTFTSPPLPIDTPADTGSTASAGNPTAADLGACHLVSVATEAGVSYAPPLLSGAVARAAPRDPGHRRPSGATGFAEGSVSATAIGIELHVQPVPSNCDQMGLQGADLLVAQRGRVSAFSLDVSHACRGCYAEGTAVPDALVAEVLTRRIRSLKDGTVKAPPEAPPPHNERSRRAT